MILRLIGYLTLTVQPCWREHPSADYEVLFPATAEMYVDGQYYKTLTIHSQEAFRRLNPATDTKRAITTPTILDKDYLEEKINLQCTFKLTDDDR